VLATKYRPHPTASDLGLEPVAILDDLSDELHRNTPLRATCPG
jgi:hypothetical protein